MNTDTQFLSKLRGYNIELRQVKTSDLEQMRVWRNDPAVGQFMLSQDTISPEQQQAWFKKISSDTGQQHFIIYYKQQAIGAANIKAFYQGESLLNARIIEPGLYIAVEKYRNNILAFAPTLLLNDYCFDTLGVSELRAIVKADNLAALNYNKKLGYKIISQQKLIEISLNKANYESASAYIKRLLSR